MENRRAEFMENLGAKLREVFREEVFRSTGAGDGVQSLWGSKNFAASGPIPTNFEHHRQLRSIEKLRGVSGDHHRNEIISISFFQHLTQKRHFSGTGRAANSDKDLSLANGACDSLLTKIVTSWNVEKPFMVMPEMSKPMLTRPSIARNLKVLEDEGATLVMGKDGKMPEDLFGPVAHMVAKKEVDMDMTEYLGKKFRQAQLLTM